MSELNRTLSFPVILLIAINSIMGTGVFFLPALAAGYAGNASILSWVFMSFVAIGLSLVFAELASMFSSAGGVYEYAKQAFSPFVSFMVGWATLIAGNVTIAMLIVGAIRYLNPELPTFMGIIFSIVFILLFNYMAYRGMQTSSVMLITFAIITLGTILSLTIPGLFRFKTASFTPFFDSSFSNVLFTAFLVAETFFGWETATFLAEETKDARTVLPKALIYSTVIIVCLVLLFVVASLSVLPASELGASKAPLADIAASLFGSGATKVFSLLVYVSIIGSVAGWIVSAPRLVMTLAKDKLFIEQLAVVHPKYKSPYKAILFQTILSSVLVIVGAGSYEVLLELLVPLVLLLYAVVVLSLLVLRKKRPDIKRYFLLRKAFFVGPLLIIILLGMVVFWALHAHDAILKIRSLLVVLLAGIPVYFLLLLTYDPDAFSKSSKLTARLSLWLENLLLPKRIRHHITKLVSVRDKRVLEFGANTGALSCFLLNKIGDGVLYCVDLSIDNINILKKRLGDRAIIIHDEHMLNRVHPSIEHVDVIVGVGYFSSLQDLNKLLREFASILPLHGTLLFVDYVDYFKILPNAGWVAKTEQLVDLFENAGFVVRIDKLKGLFWNYLFIHAIKSEKKIPFV